MAGPPKGPPKTLAPWPIYRCARCAAEFACARPRRFPVRQIQHCRACGHRSAVYVRDCTAEEACAAGLGVALFVAYAAGWRPRRVEQAA